MLLSAAGMASTQAAGAHGAKPERADPANDYCRRAAGKWMDTTNIQPDVTNRDGLKLLT